MSYTPTEWKDRIVERPRTYRIQNNPDGTITLIPEPGQVVQEGTPVNAANLNHMEQGLITHLADYETFKQNIEEALNSRVRILDLNPEIITVRNTTVETELYSFTVPGGLLQDTGGLRLKVIGYSYQGPFTNASFTWGVRFGNTTLGSISFSLGQAIGCYWNLEMLVLNAGYNQQRGGLALSLSNFSTAIPFNGKIIGIVSSVDTSVDRALSVRIQHGSAHNDIYTSKYVAVFEFLPPILG